VIEPTHETREYPFKKGRLAAYMVFGILATLIGALACVAAGAFPPAQALLSAVGGGLAVLLFGGVTAFAASRLFGRRPGLVLDHEGIIDNSSYSSVGRIPWSEIVGVRVVRPPALRNRSLGPTIQPARFLVVDVREPQRFIDGNGPLKRWLLRANAAGVGSPVAISPAVVKIDTDELAQYIRRIVGPS